MARTPKDASNLTRRGMLALGAAAVAAGPSSASLTLTRAGSATTSVAPPVPPSFGVPGMPGQFTQNRIVCA